MHAIDGCDSQKHDKTAGTCNERAFDSKFFLPHSFVDGFKDEVRLHATAQKANKTLPNLVESEDGFACLEGEEDYRCGSNWKAATSKELPPATKEVFEQTGVFACLCRHGIVEFLMEFVQSGEKCVLFVPLFPPPTLMIQGQVCSCRRRNHLEGVWGGSSYWLRHQLCPRCHTPQQFAEGGSDQETPSIGR
jgi:hypothetical protein